MSLSQQAINKSGTAFRDIPEDEQPLSEQYRIASKAYVKAKSTAKLAEDLKPSKFAELMQGYADLAVSRAELAVRGSAAWKEYVTSVVAACEQADLARAKVKWIEMRFQEWVMQQASHRKEREMGRKDP